MSESVISQNNNSLDDKLSATEPTVESNDIKDNGDAQDVEDSSPAKKIKLSNAVNDEVVTPAPAGRSGRPSKAATAKRLNILEKTAKEGEALLQNLGHKAEDNPDGNRRQTRSQTRGTPAVPSTPTKKEKATPKTPSKDTSSSGTPKRRGRPPKNSITNNSVENKTEVKTNSEQKSEKSEPTEQTNESQEKAVNNKNSNETNNNDTNDVNPSEESDSADGPPTKETVDEKPEADDEPEANEQTNELSAKTNSISDDTSKSVPVLDTQQPTTE